MSKTKGLKKRSNISPERWGRFSTFLIIVVVVVVVFVIAIILKYITDKLTILYMLKGQIVGRPGN